MSFKLVQEYKNLYCASHFQSVSHASLTNLAEFQGHSYVGEAVVNMQVVQCSFVGKFFSAG